MVRLLAPALGGYSPEPLGHLLEEQRTVILGVIDYLGKGRTPEDFSIPDLLGCLQQLSYPQILMEFHTARIQREGQHLLFNGTDIPIMRVPTPPPVEQRAVNPNEIPAILFNDPLIKDPHLRAAIFEFCTGINSTEVPSMKKNLFECYAASDERWKLIYDLQVTVCLLDSRHRFPVIPKPGESCRRGVMNDARLAPSRRRLGLLCWAMDQGPTLPETEEK